ncbi:MAG: hypothetical protein HYR91_04485 [Flavobacteriia bacterium]|nr:hypothetical protein [Flavobacteriia bacterium]
MEQITIDNYEVFYLDFLDGNLSEVATQLLFDFLNKNPELKIDLDELAPFEIDSNKKLTFFEKSLLKDFNFQTVEINDSTIEYLILANEEQLLPQVTQKRLSDYISNNSELKTIQNRYSKTHLKADLKVIYPDKNILKKERKTVPLWYSIAGIAAALVGFFMLLNHNNSSISIAKNNLHPHLPKPTIIDNLNRNKNVKTILSKKVDEIIKKEKIDTKFITLEHPHTIAIEQENEIYCLELKKVQFSAPELNEIEFETPHLKQQTKSTEIAYGFQDMENPIIPITRQLSHLTKKEVDFKISKKNTFKHKRFYFKFGKLEISRK